MKKTIGTLMVAALVIVLTATFGFAEFTATGASSFPYFQLGCLIVGGMLIVSLKYRFERMYAAEAAAAFALYTVMIALFTAPVILTVQGIVAG
jgi:hypothetical protein